MTFGKILLATALLSSFAIAGCASAPAPVASADIPTPTASAAPTPTPTATAPPPTLAATAPPSTSLCSLGYIGYPGVIVGLRGSDSAAACNGWQGVDGHWYDISNRVVPNADVVCSGSYDGLSWVAANDLSVDFGLGSTITNPLCADLNSWAHGGSYTIP